MRVDVVQDDRLMAVFVGLEVDAERGFISRR